MTTPWRRVDRLAYISSSESEHSESENPQREPPQSSLTRFPDRVMPKRSQEQELEVLETLDGLELLELRELVSDGTSESASESESSESSRLAWPKRAVIEATVAWE